MTTTTEGDKMQTVIKERFRDGTTHEYTGEIVGDDLYTIKLKLLTTVRPILKIHIMEMDRNGDLFPFGIPSDLMKISNQFKPVSDFNMCDACQWMGTKSADQYPCRYCEQNPDSKSYLKDDLSRLSDSRTP
jgi:hypothetical protein